jgi:hypothetical protein
MFKTKMLYVYLFVVLLVACSRSDGPQTMTPDCNLNSGPCVRQADGLTVTFEIFPRPFHPMREIFFAVLLEHAGNPVDDADVTIDLTMPGMYMGKNFLNLDHIGDGVYRSQGVLPRCPRGGKLWRSEVTIHHEVLGIVRVPYLFEVD